MFHGNQQGIHGFRMLFHNMYTVDISLSIRTRKQVEDPRRRLRENGGRCISNSGKPCNLFAQDHTMAFVKQRKSVKLKWSAGSVPNYISL